MPREQTSSTFGPQSREAIERTIRALGRGNERVRAAGLDPKSNEGKAFKRAVERLIAPEGNKERSTRASDKVLSLLERAALRKGVAVHVTVKATVARPNQAPQERTFTHTLPAAEVLRAPNDRAIAGALIGSESLGIPVHYYYSPTADPVDALEIARVRW